MKIYIGNKIEIMKKTNKTLEMKSSVSQKKKKKARWVERLTNRMGPVETEFKVGGIGSFRQSQ